MFSSFKYLTTTIIEKQTYFYSLGLDLSLDTHTDKVLVFFQNGAKSLFMFMKYKQT
jgi:hypothetical protein